MNACGRLNKPSLGIGACLGNKEAIEKAIELLGSYKRMIINSLQWFYGNRDKIIEADGLTVINARII